MPSAYAALAMPAARRDTELLPGPGLSKSMPCLLKILTMVKILLLHSLM